MSRFIYPLFAKLLLLRLVLKRNKTHDREIALWNARMRYKFWRKYEEEPGVKLSLRLPERLGSGDDNEQWTYTLYLYGIIISAKESFGMPQPAVALSITNMMNLHYFFAFSPFLFFSSRLPCLVVSLSASSWASEYLSIFVSVDLCWTKRMTGKSRCEMRGCV